MYAHPVEVMVSNVTAHFVWPFLFGMHPALVSGAVMLGITQVQLALTEYSTLQYATHIASTQVHLALTEYNTQ
jgi:hypothetical protein